MTAQAFVTSIDVYESYLTGPRSQIAKVFANYFAEKNPKTLLLFWINFSSQGVGMTEPVENWILRASKRCEELGFIELGKKLGKHAVHEANHHLLMIEDTHSLVDKWNALYTPSLNAEELLKQPLIEEVLDYQELHELYINGKTPYCQIAIEYEIENLAASYGSDMISHALQILGTSYKESISFLDEHALIDVAHTKFNRKVISDFIADHPATINDLITAGTKALKSYGNFLTACLKASQSSL